VRNLLSPGTCLVLLWATSAGFIASPARAQGGAESVLTCVSADGNRRHCAGYTDAGVALRRSIGSASCLLGRNWGYDALGVWVTEGCGAEFVLGNPAAEEQRVAAAAGGTAVEGSDAAAAAPEKSLGDYRFYSRFGAQTAFTGGESEVQDASSRVGFAYSVGEKVRLFAAGEWSVSLTGNENPFNPGETTAGGFVLFDRVESTTFGNRLGYVGVDFGDWGRFAIGKQWGVHYDVTSYTDQFHVFGADASATFNAGTDGGFMGTGRADSALSYRNTLFDRLEVGMQMQLRSLTNGEEVDGYGASAQLQILDGLKAGASYTIVRYDDRLKGPVLGLNGDGRYLALGLRYDSDRLNLAGVYAREKNGDLFRVPYVDEGVTVALPVVFDATGIELYGRYALAARLGLLAGYMHYEPDRDQQISDYVDPDTHLEYYIVGLDYHWFPGTTFFAEYRYANGVDALGAQGDNVFAMGFQYWFNKTGSFSYP